MLVHMRQQLMQGEGGTDLLNQYLTVLVALGGTDPGGTYNLMRPDTFRETADYALSASIGDLYIKAAVGNTCGTQPNGTGSGQSWSIQCVNVTRGSTGWTRRC